MSEARGEDAMTPEPGIIIPNDLGTTDHQRLLRAMAEYHARQQWARAFLVFGSVARGDWDALSDLDLDVVIADDAKLDPVAEAARLCAAIGEETALIAPRRGDDADVVLASLAHFSIRYHPLGATSPNIIDSMRLVWGRIDIEEIHAAGLRNRLTPASGALESELALAVRAVFYAQIGYARGKLWDAQQSLGEVRERLLALYALARDLPRPLPAFEREADAAMSNALARLLPSLTAEAMRSALLSACDQLLGETVTQFTGGRAAITPGERALLVRVQVRLSARY
jgi:predicted nucleotidyltransferase